jgi:hypothetical protein
LTRIWKPRSSKTIASMPVISTHLALRRLNQAGAEN